MRILLLSSYFTPENVAAIHLIKNRNEALIEAGFVIELIVPEPSRGVSPEIRKKYKKIRIEKSHNERMTVFRFKMFGEGKNPVLRTLRYFLCHIIHFYKGIQAKNIDVLFLASTPPTQGAMGAMVKKIKKIPLVYNLQDIFPDSLVGTGLTRKGSLLWRIGRVIENFTYRNADKIIVISDDFKKNIIAKGVPESKIEVVYNWVDENSVIPILRDKNKLFDELGLSRDCFYIVYAGNLGHAQNIDIILEAAKELNELENIKLLIFGTGGLEEQLKEKANKLNLKNLRFFPIQPADRISEVYSLGNAAIITCKPGLGKSAMPSKTWSIMSSGTAILANFDEGTEMQRIIENSKVGLFSKAGDVRKFVEAVLELYNNQEQCNQFGRNGRDFILKNLTREIGTSKYVEVIKKVVEAHQSRKN